MTEKTALHQYIANVRVTYDEEWIVLAYSEEQARAMLEACDTIDTSELEMIDWAIGKIHDAGEES
jgi:hypothetical protein